MSSSDEEEKKSSSEEQKMWEQIEQVLKPYFLSNFQKFAVQKFIKDQIGDPENKTVERARDWLFMKLNGSRMPKYYDEHQLGCPDVCPGITIQGWWEREQFSWIAELESNFEVIRDELVNLRGENGFQPYRGPSWSSKHVPDDKIGTLGHDSGMWNVFYLFLHDMEFKENCEKVPKTVEIIKKIVPREYCHAFFSALNPDSHVVAHNGPTNKKLRLHLPLIGVEGSRMRVGSVEKNPEEGKCIIFDDSFNHEAWHDGDQTRIVLIIDFWHPDLSDQEVKLFRMLQKAQLKGQRKLVTDAGDEDNLWSIIEKSKKLNKEDSWWVG